MCHFFKKYLKKNVYFFFLNLLHLYKFYYILLKILKIISLANLDLHFRHVGGNIRDGITGFSG